MFATEEAKEIAARIQTECSRLRAVIRREVEQSVVSNDEVPFIKEMVVRLPPAVDAELNAIGLSASTRATLLHQKPRVAFQHPKSGKTVACELGDLLFVVKYKLSGGTTEAKCVVWQVKSCKKQAGTDCAIDQRQLELLHRWPAFQFGKLPNGQPQSFQIAPHTLEFGSYMLMLRRPAHGDQVSAYKRDYGVTASAWRLAGSGASTLDIARLSYCWPVSEGLFAQIAFMAGEPHSTPSVQALVDALYRFVGFTPDPPHEFDGFVQDYSERPDDGVFAIIETTIQPGGDFRIH